MKCSILCNPFSAPTTPDNFVVCAVYDKVNGTLQITETTWNELVCCVYILPPSCTLHNATQSSFPVSGIAWVSFHSFHFGLKKNPGGLVIFSFLSDL